MLSIYDAADLARWDLPWWTYPAARAVEEHLTARQGRARVFEYGAGASTLWLRARAGEVISVEHDEQFMSVLGPLLGDTSADGQVVLRPLQPNRTATGDDRYVGTIAEFDGEFDLVVVDGRERVRCVQAALPRLAEGGLILLDDSQRRRYQPALTMPGTTVTEYRGLVPTLPIPRRTALIRRTG
jgi:predicted O-methyltransferase YrrM